MTLIFGCQWQRYQTSEILRQVCRRRNITVVWRRQRAATTRSSVTAQRGLQGKIGRHVIIIQGVTTSHLQQQISALCLLDLTAPFDMMEHELLLARLERSFSVHGRVFAWFRPYWTGRTNCVIYAGASSSIKHVTCSDPQGSVLGLLLFLWYTADLADLLSKHGLTLYTFADDTQFYIHYEFNSKTTSRDVLERCIHDICH